MVFGEAQRVCIMDIQRRMATCMGEFLYTPFGFGITFKGSDASHHSFVMDIQRHMATSIVTYTYFSIISLLLLRRTYRLVATYFSLIGDIPTYVGLEGSGAGDPPHD